MSVDKYDILLEKTVRDLFKSTQLIQIKKYKMQKEKEITTKDEELKQLILNKYTTLIESISALEQISSNLTDLQSIRSKLGTNIASFHFDNIEQSLTQIKFTNDFITTDESSTQLTSSFDFVNEFDTIEIQIHNKEFSLASTNISSLKQRLLSFSNKSSDNYSFYIEQYNMLIVEFCEGIMNEFISDTKLSETLSTYKTYLDTLNNDLLLNDTTLSQLEMSEFYIKILYDENVNEIYNKYFTVGTNTTTNAFTIPILVKLLILKICQNLFLLSQIKDECFICEDTSMLVYNLYQMIMSIIIISKQYIYTNNNSNDGSDSNNNIMNFLHFIKHEITTNISTMLILSKDNDTKIKQLPFIDKIIAFWSAVLNKINDNETNIENEIISQLTFDNNNNTSTTLAMFLFQNKIIDQLTNIASVQFKLYYNNNYITKNNSSSYNFIYNILHQVSLITHHKFLSLKHKIQNVVTSNTSQLLTHAITVFSNTNTFNSHYMNFIMKLTNYNSLSQLLQELHCEDIIVQINNIALIYMQNNYAQIEKYACDVFHKYLIYECLSVVTNDKVVSITESLKAFLVYLNSFEIKQNEYKTKIYLLIKSIYLKVINDNKFCSSMFVDVNVLNNVHIENNSEDYNDVLKLIEDKFKVNNHYKDNNDNTTIIGKYEIETFFNNNNNNNSQTQHSFVFQYNNGVMRKVNAKINAYSKEFIPLNSNTLNTYLIHKVKTPLITNNSNTNSTTVNTNSSCKILEHRIDENYLSLKTTKSNNASTNSGMSGGNVSSGQKESRKQSATVSAVKQVLPSFNAQSVNNTVNNITSTFSSLFNLKK